MISYWYLSAVCCIPLPNPSARLREREIFRLVPTALSPRQTSSRFAKKGEGKKVPKREKSPRTGLTLAARMARPA
jgi:hypothetical protein